MIRTNKIAKALIEKLDKDNDSVISNSEFKNLWKKMILEKIKKQEINLNTSLSTITESTEIFFTKRKYNKVNTKVNLEDLLLQMIKVEADYETTKQAICQNNDFYLENIMSYFITTQNNISSLDIRTGLSKFEVYCTHEEALLLIKRFDTLKEGFLR